MDNHLLALTGDGPLILKMSGLGLRFRGGTLEVSRCFYLKEKVIVVWVQVQ